MDSAEEYILSFVGVLVEDLEEVKISRVNNSPAILEIRVSKRDFAYVNSKYHAIQTLAHSLTGLPDDAPIIRIVEN